MSLLAISDMIVLALGLVSIITGFRQPKETKRIVRFDERQIEAIKHIRDNNGLGPAVEKLREIDPDTGLSVAKRLVDSL